MDKISLKKLNRIGDHLLSNYVPNNLGGFENHGYYLLEHKGYYINEINK